jgi:hypothetical protein
MDTDNKIIPCAKCGSSERIIPMARVIHQTQGGTVNLRVAVEAHPEALFFKGTMSSDIYARVCCDCGHITLFSPRYGSEPDNLDTLWNAYLESQKSAS